MVRASDSLLVPNLDSRTVLNVVRCTAGGAVGCVVAWATEARCWDRYYGYSDGLLNNNLFNVKGLNALRGVKTLNFCVCSGGGCALALGHGLGGGLMLTGAAFPLLHQIYESARCDMDIDEVEDENWVSVASVILGLLGVGALYLRS